MNLHLSPIDERLGKRCPFCGSRPDDGSSTYYSNAIEVLIECCEHCVVSSFHVAFPRDPSMKVEYPHTEGDMLVHRYRKEWIALWNYVVSSIEHGHGYVKDYDWLIGFGQDIGEYGKEKIYPTFVRWPVNEGFEVTLVDAPMKFEIQPEARKNELELEEAIKMGKAMVGVGYITGDSVGELYVSIDTKPTPPVVRIRREFK